jgi:hypothetical protein
LSVSVGPDRGPLIVPIWYQYIPGGEPWILTTVSRTAPGTDEMVREMSARYLPPEQAAAYIEFSERELGEQVAIYLQPPAG